MEFKTLANKVFLELCERIPREQFTADPNNDNSDGIITSINEFISLIIESSEIYYQIFTINDRDKLLFIEEFPKELFQRMNNQESSLEIDNNTLRDMRVVTYLADEQPASVGAHALGKEGIRNIKPRLVGVFPDQEYTGYSILRYAKDVEAHVTFKVWGIDAVDIRKRSSMLRKLIETNTWLLKKRGLKEIIWTGSRESDLWDKQNLVKMKSENYFIRYSEVSDTREKNVEQVVMQLGLTN